LQSAIESHGYQVVAVAGSIKQAQAFMAQTNPDAIIVDINLPDGSGFDLVSWSRRISPTIAIVVLTFNDGAEYVRAAKNAGADAFIVKSAPLSDVLAALDFAISSPGSFSSNRASIREIDSGLSAREIDVLQAINLGLSNDAIALSLFISVSTVKTHVSSILRKLNASNRVQALTIAREQGLLV
jgi:DNA-binding NarL/FixJ family response regulator